MRLRGRTHDCELGLGLVRVLRKRARQQTCARKLAAQKRHACILIETRVIGFDARYAEQIGNDPRVHVGVLPQVQGGQVKPATVHGPDQAPESSPCGQESCTTLGQRMRDLHQIGAQLFGTRVRFSRYARAAGRRMAGNLLVGRGQAGVATGERAAVGLVASRRIGIAAALSQFLDLGGRGGQLRRDGQFRAQCVQLIQVVVERRPGGLGQGQAQGVGSDIGIAIPIAANPASEPQEAARPMG